MTQPFENRRGFLRQIGLVAVALSAAPLLPFVPGPLPAKAVAAFIPELWAQEALNILAANMDEESIYGRNYG